MLPILTRQAYRGFSAWLPDGGGASVAFIGRVMWPGGAEVKDAVIKLYDADSCGVANEIIGYSINESRGIRQPERAAVMLLSPAELLDLGRELGPYTDARTGYILCWLTSYEQGLKPFNYVRRLSTFGDRQLLAFCKSAFCRQLVIADNVTGNNDRHEGNLLYIDDLHYMAIDQGAVGGGTSWHLTWPDKLASNELLRLVENCLKPADLKAWKSEVIVQHEQSQVAWPDAIAGARDAVDGFLTPGAKDDIADYMSERAAGSSFANACGKLL